MGRTIRILLLAASVGSLLAVGLLPAGEGPRSALPVRNAVLLSVSFSALLAVFVTSDRFREAFGERTVSRALLLLFSGGALLHLALGYLLHGDDVRRAVETALDSIAYFTQARIFSAGHLSVPSHALKDFFTTGFCINDGRFYSLYFPGWPAILAVGILSGIPWLINPLFGLLTLPVLYLTGKEIHDRDTGLFAAALLLVSPIFLTLTPTFMSDPTALFFSSLFFYLMVRTLKEPAVHRAAAAGLSLGAAFLIRPYSAMVMSVPVLACFAYASLKDGKRDWASPLALSLSFAPFVLLLLAYNRLQTGSFFLTPFAYYNPLSALGFGMRSRDVVAAPFLFTPMDGIARAARNLAVLNTGVVPFLFLYLLFVLLGGKNRWDLLLFSTLLVTVAAHVPYYDATNRHYYSSFFALFLLAARGIRLSGESVRRFFPRVPVNNLPGLILLFVVAASLSLGFFPQKLRGRVAMYGTLRDPFRTVERERLSDAVVFLGKVPEKYNNATYYVQNPLDFEGDVLFAKDLGERNRELMDHYPGKAFYSYAFDPAKGSGRLTRLR